MPMIPRLRAYSGALGAIATLALGSSVAYAQAAPPFQPQGGRSGTPEAPPAPGAVTPPQLQNFVQAEYPAEARTQGLSATVLLALTIDEAGHVAEATVLEGAGHGFDEAAIAAARQFVFRPAQQDGHPVPVRIRYRYRFNLEVEAPPQAPVSAVLRGVVRDAQNRPLAGASVTATPSGGTAVQTTTDVAGEFRFELATQGSIGVDVTAAEYQPFHAEERVFDRDDVRVIYRLTPVRAPAQARPAQPDDENGVTVRAARPAREVTRTTVDRREIQRIPGTGGDALRSIQNLPGLARPPFLSGALIVRGSSAADTQIFVDGTTLPLLYHFGGLSSTIQTEMLDRIDFYPGNFSTQFGRAIGGVVDVGLRSPRAHGYHAVAQIGDIDASIFAEGPITKNISIAIGLRRSYIDVILGAVLNAANTGVIAAPVYYDGQVVAEWRPNASNRVRLALLGDDDTLKILFTRPSDAAPTFAGSLNFATRYYLAQLSWTHILAPTTQGRAMLSFGWTSLAFQGGELIKFALDNYPLEFRYEFSHAMPSIRTRVNAGFDVHAYHYNVDFSIQGLGSDDSTGGESLRFGTSVGGWLVRPGFYADAEITPIPGVRIVPGMRIDYFGEIGRTTVSPRLVARWEPARDWTLKAGIGQYTQPPSPLESSGAMNSFIPGQSLGNPHLYPQVAMHYALGIEHTFRPEVSGFGETVLGSPHPEISISLEGFYKTLSSLVESTPAVDQLRDPTAAPYNNAGIGRVFGLELLVRYRATQRMFGWIAYTLSRSERRDNPNADWRLFGSDQTHIFTAVLSYNLGKGFELGLRFRYVTGSPATPVIGSYYNADTRQYTPISGAPNSVRNADFNQLDLRFDKTFRYRWGSWGVFLEVLNVYNATNQEGTVYNYNYTQSGPLGGLPIYPNLGIRGEL